MNRCLFFSFATCIAICLSADESPQADILEPTVQLSEGTILSEALGHLIGKNLKSLEIPLDLNALAKGLKDESEGFPSPLSDEECVQRLSLMEEKCDHLKKAKNLEEAEQFLAHNRERHEVTSLLDGKVQFEIVKEGQGEEVSRYNSPLVRYEGKFLDGTCFTSGSQEELISLEEAIPGLSEGLAGMKEGEVRRLYVHPEAGYGDNDPFHPNSLLIFEVELMEAEGQKGTTDAALLSEGEESQGQF